MHSTLHLLTSVSLILSLSGTAFAAPRPMPEDKGADGTCSPPVIAVSSAPVKLKQGPYLVSGARSDANPNPTSGGQASFSDQFSVSTTYSIGGAFNFEVDAPDLLRLVDLGFAFIPTFSISITMGTATTVNTVCPANTSKNNYTITWGLQYYQYSYSFTGTKTYGGYNPQLADCDTDEIEHQNQVLPWNAIFPAHQDGAKNGASDEIEYQCCTDSESAPWPGSPVCPAAS